MTAGVFLIFGLLASSAFCWRVVDYVPLPGGVRFMTWDGEVLWINRAQPDSLLQAINPFTGEVLHTISGPRSPCRGIASTDSGLLYLSRERLYLINVQGRVVRDYQLGREDLWGLADADSGFWSVGLGHRPIRAFNLLLNGEDRLSFQLPNSSVGDLAASRDYLWCTDPASGWVYQIAIREGRVEEVYPSPRPDPTAIALADTLLYLVDQGDQDDTDFLYTISLTQPAAPRLLPSSQRVDFGLVLLNVAAIQSLTLYNIGSDTLRIDSLRLQSRNEAFRLGQLPWNLRIGPGRFIVVNITFTPRDYAPYRDSLLIFSNDPYNGRIALSLFGHGLWSQRRLGVYPDTIDFGRVRADRRRDGSRIRNLALFNEGNDRLAVNEFILRLSTIFRAEMQPLPFTLEPAETTWISITFSPTRAITYLDTLIIGSNDQWRYNFVYLIGQGDEANFPSGSLLWSFYAPDQPLVNLIPTGDANEDNVLDVVGVTREGVSLCLNGFSSGTADILWRRAPALGVGGQENGSLIIGGLRLNNDGVDDIVVALPGSGYIVGIEGRRGRILWEKNTFEEEANLIIAGLAPGGDINGDGLDDYYILSRTNDRSALSRCEGSTGRRMWEVYTLLASNFHSVADMTGDGVEEIVVLGDGGGGEVYSGTNGQRLFRFSSPQPLTSLILPGERNPNGVLVVAYEEGLIAFDLTRTASQIWRASNRQLGLPDGDRLAHLYYSREAFPLQVPYFCYASRQGTLGILNSVEGSVFKTGEAGGEVTALAALPSVRNIHPLFIVAGLRSGEIRSFSSEYAELRPTWEFYREGVFPVKLFPFDDVDLGGAPDLAALYSDGWVGAISNGGNLEVKGGRAVPDGGSNLCFLYPTPFNPSGHLQLLLSRPIDGPVTFCLYDISGRLHNRIVMDVSHTNHITLTGLIPYGLAAGYYYITYQGLSLKGVVSGVLIR